VNVASFQYDELNRMTQAEQGGNGGVFARSHYRYDNLSREVATWRDEDGSKGERFGYNASNQLTSAAYKADQVWTGNPLNATRTVGYDYTPETLNRSIVTDNGIGTGYVADGINQYTAIGAQAPGYDGNFNLASYAGASYTFNPANQLISAINPGIASAQFVYDGLGRCVKRTINGGVTVITYDEWNPIYERDGAGNFKAWNIYGARADEILVRYDVSVGPLVYKQDREGNVVFLLDGNGNGLEKYTYDAFGQPTITEWDGGYPRNQSWRSNRFMFTGREYFAEFGIYDYRHRFYHPALGRFLQTDPMGLQTEGEKLSAGQKALFSPAGSAPDAFSSSEMNLYRYCGDDPVDNSDPLGLIFTDEVETQEVDLIRGGKGLGQTFPVLDVNTVRQGDGSYALRLDVRIVQRLVAQRALFHGKIIPRTDDQKAATHTHEEQYHHDDWKGFHDAKQKEIPGTKYRTKPEAEAAAKPLEEKLNKEMRKANEQFEQHRPDSRWDALRRREGI
jgi:RHS repeat-associated protein